MSRPTFLQLAPASARLRGPLLLHCADAALVAEDGAPGYWSGVLERGGVFLLVRFCADREGVAIDVAGPAESLGALEGALGRAQLRGGPGMHREYVTDMRALRSARARGREVETRGVLRELDQAPSVSPLLPAGVTFHAPDFEPLGAAEQHGTPGFVSVVAQAGGLFLLARFAYAPLQRQAPALDLALARGLSQLGAAAARAAARSGAGSHKVHATDREAIGKAQRLLQRRARGLSEAEGAPNLASTIKTEVR